MQDSVREGFIALALFLMMILPDFFGKMVENKSCFFPFRTFRNSFQNPSPGFSFVVWASVAHGMPLSGAGE